MLSDGNEQGMSKEIYISSTPHETRLAIVENDELREIYYERENEYTLAGSIYNGKVTRVLPGMQSAFVDIGLERDAFLYVTDFMEEQGDSDEFDPADSGEKRGESRGERGDSRGGRGRRGGDRGRRLPGEEAPVAADTSAYGEMPAGEGGEAASEAEADGGRRWRGRRGRRRPGGREREPQAEVNGQPSESGEAAEFIEPEMYGSADERFDESASDEGFPAAEGSSTYGEVPAEGDESRSERGDGRRGGRERGGRDRGGRGGRERGGRSGGRERRPRESSDYGYGAAEDVSDAPAGEPIVLPGEKLRKYNPEAFPEEARIESASAAEAKPVEEFVATGWDGGLVLPGETIRPRGPVEGAESSSYEPREDRGGRERGRGGRDDRRGGRERGGRDGGRGGRDRGGRDRGSRRDSFSGPAAEPQHAQELNPVNSEETVELTGGYIEEEQTEETFVAPAETVAAAEGLEISASAQHGSAERFEETANASFRAHPEQASYVQQTETAEEHTAAPVANAEETSQAEQALAEGEIAVHAPAGSETTEEAAPDMQETVKFASPVESEATSSETAEYEPKEGESAGTRTDAPRSGFLRWRERRAAAKAEKEAAARKAEEEKAALSAPEHNFTTMQPTGEMISRTEASEMPQQDEPMPSQPIAHEGAVQSVPLAEAQTTPFHFGDGVIEEEEVDEDVDFHLNLHAHSMDEDDFETEEETLEGEPHLGVPAHDVDSDDEDSDDEGFAEESEGEEESEGGEQAAAPAGRERRGRGGREGGRDGRRGGSRDGRRDSRGGREGGRGRGRQSMQTQDLPAINELLKPGQEVLLQIAKEPIAKKGARVTSHIALPGRFLVFMPTVNHTGVSRKISSDDERRRLKSILLSEKGDATGGFIVRTAADGASEEELRSDLRFLINLWNDIKSRSEASKSPALIYHDLNLVERILRDQVTDNFSAIWVDTEAEYERVLRFLQRFAPSLVRRVKLYTKETPLFEQFGITNEIDKALKSKVWLKSGGSIVINQTEALVAIDINTGKYVGKTARLEDTIVKTNLDAIPEIVRQIRLRDLGGIIVIDFIDMDDRKNRHKVLAALEEELKNDRAPSKVLQFNDFGLVAITRKRVRQSLERTLSTPCVVCSGTGMVKSPVTIANEIYVEMRKMYRHIDKGDMMLRVHPDVVKQLKLDNSRWLHDMEEMTRKTILVKSDPSLSPEAFDIH